MLNHFACAVKFGVYAASPVVLYIHFTPVHGRLLRIHAQFFLASTREWPLYETSQDVYVLPSDWNRKWFIIFISASVTD